MIISGLIGLIIWRRKNTSQVLGLPLLEKRLLVPERTLVSTGSPPGTIWSVLSARALRNGQAVCSNKRCLVPALNCLVPALNCHAGAPGAAI